MLLSAYGRENQVQGHTWTCSTQPPVNNHTEQLQNFKAIKSKTLLYIDSQLCNEIRQSWCAFTGLT